MKLKEGKAASLIAQAVHTALRKGTEASGSSGAHRAIREIEGPGWHEACQWAVGSLEHMGYSLVDSKSLSASEASLEIAPWIDHPDWGHGGPVRDWRSCVSEGVRSMWHTFTRKQKLALYESFDQEANREPEDLLAWEEWD